MRKVSLLISPHTSDVFSSPCFIIYSQRSFAFKITLNKKFLELLKVSDYFSFNQLINNLIYWIVAAASCCLPEPSVCSDRPVSPAQLLIGRLDRWCNTTSAPVKQTEKWNTWIRSHLICRLTTRYLRDVGGDPTESRQRTPRKRTQCGAPEFTINPLNYHRITMGRGEGQFVTFLYGGQVFY